MNKWRSFKEWRKGRCTRWLDRRNSGHQREIARIKYPIKASIKQATWTARWPARTMYHVAHRRAPAAPWRIVTRRDEEAIPVRVSINVRLLTLSQRSIELFSCRFRKIVISKYVRRRTLRNDARRYLAIFRKSNCVKREQLKTYLIWWYKEYLRFFSPRRQRANSKITRKYTTRLSPLDCDVFRFLIVLQA